ncbi:unnamed protein product [Penicillium discolor]
MSTLDDLFAGDRHAPSGARDHGSTVVSAKLERLIGEPRREPLRVHGDAETLRLREMVTAPRPAGAVEGVSPPRAPAAPSRRARRRRLRIDGVSAIAAALAIAAVVGAAGFAGVKAASTSPAETAAEALTEDRAALDSAMQGLQAAAGRLNAQTSAESEAAAAARSMLVELDVTVVDPVARDAAVAAADTYIGALRTLVTPALPQLKPPSPVDTGSLPDVAAAIDDVRAQAQLVDERLTQALSSFAAGFSDRAEREVRANPAATAQFRDAVTAAAARVATAALNEPDGQAALLAYQEAVRALRADDRRERLEVEQAQRGQADQSAEEQGGDPTAPPEVETAPESGTEPQP